MKTYLFNQRTILMSAALLLTTACSQMSFTPSPDATPNTSASTTTNPDGSTTDSFLFNQNGTKAKVDVLFIDDNSGSMENKQIRLGSALGSFIGSLGQIDWQIGITTTDTSDDPNYGLQGSLLPFAGTTSNILTSMVPDYSTKFANTIHRTEVGTADERGMRAMMMSFGKRNAENFGFFRSTADLAVVILSDEDEASDGGATTTDPANTPSEVVQSFTNAFGRSKTMTVYGVIIAPSDTACYNAQQAEGSKYGTILNNLVTMTNGVVGSICDTDYGATLAAIGNRVVQGVRTATLSAVPAGNFQVVVTPADPTLTWVLNGRVLAFNKPPAKNTKVDVTYFPQ